MLRRGSYYLQTQSRKQFEIQNTLAKRSWLRRIGLEKVWIIQPRRLKSYNFRFSDANNIGELISRESSFRSSIVNELSTKSHMIFASVATERSLPGPRLLFAGYTIPHGALLEIGPLPQDWRPGVSHALFRPILYQHLPIFPLAAAAGCHANGLQGVHRRGPEPTGFLPSSRMRLIHDQDNSIARQTPLLSPSLFSSSFLSPSLSSLCLSIQFLRVKLQYQLQNTMVSYPLL